MDIYLAIRRIQELEQEVYALTKRAEHAESSVVLMRKTNKDLAAKRAVPQTQTVYAPNSVLVEYRTNNRFSLELLDDSSYMNHLTNNQVDSLCLGLGRDLIGQGFVKLTVTMEEDHYNREGIRQLKGELRVCQQTTSPSRY